MKAYLPPRILSPYDGLEKTVPSVEYAARLATLLGARLYVLHVVPGATVRSVKDDLDAASDEEAQAHCEARCKRQLEGLAAIGQAGLDCTTSVCFSRTVADGVIGFCEENRIDLVVTRKATSVGGLDTPLPERLIGTEGIECLICKHPLPEATEQMTVLIPVDNRRSNLACVCRGVGLAGALRCGVIFYYATQSLSPLTRETCSRDVLGNLALAEELARAKGVGCEVRLANKPFVEGVLDAAVSSGADLIVMRDFGHEESLMGSFQGSINLQERSRREFYFGSAARAVDEQSEHNFLYCEQPRECHRCGSCEREHEADAQAH